MSMVVGYMQGCHSQLHPPYLVLERQKDDAECQRQQMVSLGKRAELVPEPASYEVTQRTVGSVLQVTNAIIFLEL